MRKILSLFAALVFSSVAIGQVTPNLNLNIPVANTPNWGTLLNNNFGTLDALLSGVTALPALNVTGPAILPELQTWQTGTTYSSGEVVAYQGIFYSSIASGNVGNLPTNTSFWSTSFGGGGGSPSGAAGGVLSGTYPNPGYAVTPLTTGGNYNSTQATQTPTYIPSVGTILQADGFPTSGGTYAGTWSSTATYNRFQTVTYGGVDWIAVNGNANVTPAQAAAGASQFWAQFDTTGAGLAATQADCAFYWAWEQVQVHATGFGAYSSVGLHFGSRVGGYAKNGDWVMPTNTFGYTISLFGDGRGQTRIYQTASTLNYMVSSPNVNSSGGQTIQGIVLDANLLAGGCLTHHLRRSLLDDIACWNPQQQAGGTITSTMYLGQGADAYETIYEHLLVRGPSYSGLVPAYGTATVAGGVVTGITFTGTGTNLNLPVTAGPGLVTYFTGKGAGGQPCTTMPGQPTYTITAGGIAGTTLGSGGSGCSGTIYVRVQQAGTIAEGFQLGSSDSTFNDIVTSGDFTQACEYVDGPFALWHEHPYCGAPYQIQSAGGGTRNHFGPELDSPIEYGMYIQGSGANVFGEFDEYNEPTPYGAGAVLIDAAATNISISGAGCYGGSSQAFGGYAKFTGTTAGVITTANAPSALPASVSISGTIENCDGTTSSWGNFQPNITGINMTLGSSGTLGSLTLGNATSGTVNIQAVPGALSNGTISIPNVTDTAVVLNATQALTNKSFPAGVTIGGTPTAPTATPGTATTQLATTAFAGAAATAAQAASLQKSSNLSDLTSTATARTNLGLGSAATQPTSAFDAAGAAAAILSGSNTFYATSYSGATIAEKVNACLTAAIAVGGVCDASGLTGTGLNENGGSIVAATLDATIVVGNLFSSPVSLILPGWAWWEWNMTGGTSCGIQQYSGTQITTKDFGSAIQGLSVYSAATGSDLLAVLCVNASSSQSGGNYVFDGGFGINNGPFGHGAVTASGAAVLINGGLDDVSTFDHLGVGDNLDTYAVEVEGGICCSATFRSVQFNGFNTTIPLYFNNTTGNSLSAVNIVDSSIVHNPTGSPLILVSDTSAAHASNINISNLYSEVYPTSGTTQGELAIQGAGQVNVSNWTLKAESGSMSNPAISTSTAANTSLAVRSLYLVNGGGSWVSTDNPISNGNVSASLSDPRIDSGGNFQEYLYSSSSSPGIIGSLWSMGNINGMSMYSWGTGNTTIGGAALPLTSTGTNDTAVGGNALGDNTSGSSNTAVGGLAGALETSGSDNTAVGYHALEQLTTGGNNTALGYQAGQNGTLVQTNSNSTFLGYEADASANALTNDTALGAGSMVTASNQVVIGNSSVTDVYLGSGGTTVGAAANLHANAVSASGGVSATSDGVHAGYADLVGNTANPAVVANTAGWMGPSSSSFTAYACQFPSTPPSGGQVLSCATPTSGVSVGTWVTPGSSGVVLVPATTAANTIAPTANGVVGLTVTATTGTGSPDVADFPGQFGNYIHIDSFGDLNGTGSVLYAAYQFKDATQFTVSGCSAGTLLGGDTGGSFHSGTSGTCTVTITLGGHTATNGWTCWSNDLTTPADVLHQTAASNTTTAVLSGTTVTGDVVNFGCMEY